MPVGLLGRGQGPFERIGGQALTNVGVLGDVTVIVIVHEGMAIDGVVESQRYHREKQADDRVAFLGRGEDARRLRCGRSFLGGRQYQDLTTEDTEDTEAFCTSISVITVTIVTAKYRPKGIQPQRTRRTQGMHFNEISGAAVDSAMKVHSVLGPGLLESVYVACLVHELNQRGFHTAIQLPLPVIYEGVRLDLGFG